MKKPKIGPAIQAGVASLLTLVIPIATAGGAKAISSCPTDPLSALTPYNTNYDDPSAVNVGVKFDVHGAPYVDGVDVDFYE